MPSAPATFEPLRNRDYRLLFGALAISLTGDGVWLVAIAFQVIELGGGPVALSKPGITGWAQVNGWRGATDTAEKLQRRVEHDLYYIDNWSISFDLRIMFLTVVRLFFDENAY